LSEARMRVLNTRKGLFRNTWWPRRARRRRVSIVWRFGVRATCSPVVLSSERLSVSNSSPLRPSPRLLSGPREAEAIPSCPMAFGLVSCSMLPAHVGCRAVLADSKLPKTLSKLRLSVAREAGACPSFPMTVWVVVLVQSERIGGWAEVSDSILPMVIPELRKSELLLSVAREADACPSFPMSVCS
jgi:hypothetical protein